MPDLTFAAFNLLEASFWVFCAGVSLSGQIFVKNLPKKFWQLFSVNFTLFAASDLTEVYYPMSFLDHGGEWLLAWKIICIIGFIYFFAWYIAIRMKA